MVAMSAGNPATEPENSDRAEVGFDVDDEGDWGWGMVAISAGKPATDPVNEDSVNDEGAKGWLCWWSCWVGCGYLMMVRVMAVEYHEN